MLKEHRINRPGSLARYDTWFGTKWSWIQIPPRPPVFSKNIHWWSSVFLCILAIDKGEFKLSTREQKLQELITIVENGIIYESILAIDEAHGILIEVIGEVLKKTKKTMAGKSDEQVAIEMNAEIDDPINENERVLP